MNISLIITTYNWPESLELVLESVRCQNISPSEIIVADDGSDFKTKDAINNFNNDYGLKIMHSWQEDKGFRAAKARNKAILHSSGDYIILIDGDTILHPNFVRDHHDFSEPGYFVQGSRVLVSKKETHKAIANKNINFSLFSQNISNRKNSIHSQFLSYLFSSKLNSINGIKSCNMAFFREDCLKINGFNNDFEGWGREDSEFVIRLMNNGINRKNIRFKAIQYHLWHKENSRESLTKNDDILNEAILKKIKWCRNGLKTMRQNES